MAGELSFRELLSPHASDAGLDRLVRYAELLERWSRRHNLVSWKSRKELIQRHFEEALVAREFMAGGGALLDVGSGGGLPGVPLLAVNLDWSGVLLEPRQKRWAFLRQVANSGKLRANLTSVPDLNPSLKGNRLQYRIRSISFPRGGG